MSWIAIGVLSLLALSMLISSTRFRVFISTGAVIVVMVVPVLAYFGTRKIPAAGSATPARQRPFVTWQFQITKAPNLVTSAQVLADMEADIADSIDSQVAESVPGDGSLDEPVIEVSHAAIGNDEVSPDSQQNKSGLIYGRRIILRPSIGNVPQKVTLHENIASVIREYLGTQHNPSLDPGVGELQPENLDWQRLKYLDKGTDTNGVKQVTLVFDDEFHRHVRERGLQLVTKDHLKKAGYTSVGTLTMLTLLYGLLKLKQARREAAPASDLLASSGVWMV